ncbi:MAG: MFS transporter [Symbiopectobacterium sp.]|uniref:MFS transporter n=1 Tax=Symbiopectobacterium sp. TaxID=2952789 RepID=UPI0039E77503
MQVLAAFTVAMVALLEGAAMGILFAMGLFVAFTMATMDIALDALAVERIHPAWRPCAAACKLGALSTGAMIGGGAFVALFHTYGWKAIFLCYAASLLLLVLPVLLLMKEVPHAGLPNAERRDAASLSTLLRNPVQRKRLILLTLACCVIFPIAGLNRLMLIDLNVPMEQIGGIVGTLGPITMLINRRYLYAADETVWAFRRADGVHRAGFTGVSRDGDRLCDGAGMAGHVGRDSGGSGGERHNIRVVARGATRHRLRCFLRRRAVCQHAWPPLRGRKW